MPEVKKVDVDADEITTIDYDAVLSDTSVWRFPGKL